MARTEGAFKKALEKVKGQETAVLEAGNLAQITTLKEQSQQLRSFGTGVYQQTLQLLFLAQNFNPFTETPEPFYTEKTNPLLAERDLNKFLGNVIQQVALAEQAGIPRETIEQEAGIRIRALPLPEDVQLPQYGHLVVIELIDKSSPEEYQLTLARFGGTIPPTPIGISDKGEEVYDQREISIGMNFGLQLDSPVHNWLTQTRTFNPALLSETSELDFPMPMLEEAKRYATDFIGKDVWHYTEITDLTPVEDIPDIEASNKQTESKAAAAERFINAIDLDAIYLAREEKAEAQRIKDEEIAEKQRIKDVERAAKLARLKEAVDRVNGGNKQRLTELATVLGLGDEALVIHASVNLQQEKGRHVVKSVRSIQGKLNSSLEPKEAVTYTRQGNDVTLVINGKTIEFSASGIKGLSQEDQNALLIIFIQYAGLPSGKQNEKANAKAIRNFLADVAKIRFPQEPKPERRLTAGINGNANGTAPVETVPVQPVGPNETNGNSGANGNQQQIPIRRLTEKEDTLTSSEVTLRVTFAAYRPSPIQSRAESTNNPFHTRTKADIKRLTEGKVTREELLGEVLERRREAIHAYAEIAETLAEEATVELSRRYKSQKGKKTRLGGEIELSLKDLVQQKLSEAIPGLKKLDSFNRGVELLTDEAARTWAMRYMMPENLLADVLDDLRESPQTDSTRNVIAVLEHNPISLAALYKRDSIDIEIEGKTVTLKREEVDSLLDPILLYDEYVMQTIYESFFMTSHPREPITKGLRDALSFTGQQKLVDALAAGFGKRTKDSVLEAVEDVIIGKTSTTETLETTQTFDTIHLEHNVTIVLTERDLPYVTSSLHAELMRNPLFIEESDLMHKWLNGEINRFQATTVLFPAIRRTLALNANLVNQTAEKEAKVIIAIAQKEGSQKGEEATTTPSTDRRYAQVVAKFISHLAGPKIKLNFQPSGFSELRTEIVVNLALNAESLTADAITDRKLLQMILDDTINFLLRDKKTGIDPRPLNVIVKHQEKIMSLSENELWDIFNAAYGHKNSAPDRLGDKLAEYFPELQNYMPRRRR